MSLFLFFNLNNIVCAAKNFISLDFLFHEILVQNSAFCLYIIVHLLMTGVGTGTVSIVKYWRDVEDPILYFERVVQSWTATMLLLFCNNLVILNFWNGIYITKLLFLLLLKLGTEWSFLPRALSVKVVRLPTACPTHTMLLLLDEITLFLFLWWNTFFK